jgi:hypothetical protein
LLGRLIVVNVLVLVALLTLIEGAARVVIYFVRGTSTVGLPQRMQHLHYQPFVMFGPDLESRLAATSYGPIADRLRIVIVGGSTAQHLRPTLLGEAVTDRLPNRPVQVINAAFAGYEARQEVIVAAIWVPALRPDVIVSIDGANDLISRVRVDRAGTFYLDPAYRLYLTRPFVAPFAYLLSQSQAYNGLLRLRARATLAPPDIYADAVPVYVEAQHSLNVMARGLGAQRVMVLQPFVAYKRPQSTAEANFTVFKYREAALMHLYELTHGELTKLARTDSVRYVDGRRLFDGVAETIFSDDVHFVDDKGYRILAAAIAAQIDDVGKQEPNVTSRRP